MPESRLKPFIALAAVIALVIIGFWVVKIVFSALFYLIMGALAVGAGWLIYTMFVRGQR